MEEEISSMLLLNNDSDKNGTIDQLSDQVSSDLNLKWVSHF